MNDPQDPEATTPSQAEGDREEERPAEGPLRTTPSQAEGERNDTDAEEDPDGA